MEPVDLVVGIGVEMLRVDQVREMVLEREVARVGEAVVEVAQDTVLQAQ